MIDFTKWLWRGLCSLPKGLLKFIDKYLSIIITLTIFLGFFFAFRWMYNDGEARRKADQEENMRQEAIRADCENSCAPFQWRIIDGDCFCREPDNSWKPIDAMGLKDAE
jgi:hypothetical protein